MKFFHISNNKYNGVLHYLYEYTNKVFPTIDFYGKKDINKDDPIALISSPETATVFINQISSEDTKVYFDIDLGENAKAFATYYQIGTAIGGSPPYTWTISGSNNKNEWVMITKEEEYDDLCNSNEGGTSCINRQTTNFDINEETGPFRYFRFNLIKNRYIIIESPPKYTNGIRLGGFEIYGGLYLNDESIYKRITHHENIINLSPLYSLFLLL